MAATRVDVMKRFQIDGRNVRTFGDFIEAVNVGFVRPAGGEWRGNLDAFNDYLVWPDEEQYELELLGAESCAAALGHNAKATWIRGVMRTCHPSNLGELAGNLREARAGRGPTLFDTIREIIDWNPHVRFIQS